MTGIEAMGMVASSNDRRCHDSPKGNNMTTIAAAADYVANTDLMRQYVASRHTEGDPTIRYFANRILAGQDIGSAALDAAAGILRMNAYTQGSHEEWAEAILREAYGLNLIAR